MKFTINPNWRNENLKCHFCGEIRSVKYKTNVVVLDSFPDEEGKVKEVPICSKCALIDIGASNGD